MTYGSRKGGYFTDVRLPRIPPVNTLADQGFTGVRSDHHGYILQLATLNRIDSYLGEHRAQRGDNPVSRSIAEPPVRSRHIYG